MSVVDGGAAVPGEPEGLGVERAGGALGDGIELDAQVPAEDDGQDVAGHRLLPVHGRGEGGDEHFPVRRRVVPGQHVRRVVRCRELLVEPLLLTGERIAVLVVVRPEGPAECAVGEVGERLIAPGERGISVGAGIGQEDRRDVGGIPGEPGNAPDVLPHHVPAHPLEVSRRGLGELAQVVLVDAERARVAFDERDLALVEPPVDQRHDGEEAHGALGEGRVRQRPGQLLRRGRRQRVDVERVGAPEHVAIGGLDRGAIGRARGCRDPAHRAEDAPDLRLGWPRRSSLLLSVHAPIVLDRGGGHAHSRRASRAAGIRCAGRRHEPGHALPRPSRHLPRLGRLDARGGRARADARRRARGADDGHARQPRAPRRGGTARRGGHRGRPRGPRDRRHRGRCDGGGRCPRIGRAPSRPGRRGAGFSRRGVHGAAHDRRGGSARRREPGHDLDAGRVCHGRGAEGAQARPVTSFSSATMCRSTTRSS